MSETEKTLLDMVASLQRQVAELSGRLAALEARMLLMTWPPVVPPVPAYPLPGPSWQPPFIMPYKVTPPVRWLLADDWSFVPPPPLH